ncbi:hypothetical protein EN866_33425 [Mesorhizobium sp. M2D.F.Ca.ET.223.01.1.1]|uniref:hypothetical protein n=1 Tax=Mesorhizobium sp. M2D.F.Ca.ET.223.01.1.1 TaxID=2563940 RepID=UPI0010928EE0|nr:hypothetical protein [Mesorhizobium sp. M2D.F.Ca.ET.223.01.1.1]TGR84247.1 hypothetical protein EN866_33425 [Mesorhizobium sp. M2D.F.Ca.ET.223.01.1.1]TGT75203.1 hypothetical protein EN802_09370 [bacterium M00.F.Ca.ET.159.01.1.1]TGT88070.1 hypothetical protein EN800_06260 [bacterium M00.F.Ca.ET.157.01.1.1]
MADLSPTMQAIENHINASAECRRQCELSDWGLIPKDSEFASCDAMDEALVAVCAARPLAEDDLKAWRRYLRSVEVARRIEGQDDLTARVVAALIGGET